VRLFYGCCNRIIPAFELKHLVMAYQATNPTTRSGTTLRLRLTPERRDFWAFTLWVLVTFIQFPGDELILYPLALYFTYSIWRDQTR